MWPLSAPSIGIRIFLASARLNPVGRANATFDPRRGPPRVGRAGTTTSSRRQECELTAPSLDTSAVLAVGRYRGRNGIRRQSRSLRHPRIACVVGIHARTATAGGLGAQFVVPGLVAVDLAQAVRAGIQPPSR